MMTKVKEDKEFHGILVDASDTSPIETVSKRDIDRWRRINRARMNSNWNKDGFMSKMAVGYLLDGDTARRFLLVNGMEALSMMESTINEMRKRITEGGTLNEDEVATMKVMTDGSKAYVEMASTLLEIADKGNTNGKSLLTMPKLPEQPSFYKQEIHLHTNGEKKADAVEVKSETVNTSSPDQR